jgi:hypothetical protein
VTPRWKIRRVKDGCWCLYDNGDERAHFAVWENAITYLEIYERPAA